ncbi:MAG: hypothetical protein Q8R48_00185 [Candidatus Omnitrophota bacterium]|nr:hypothetical protein [Candidatus Omnitrophota bacterium]
MAECLDTAAYKKTLLEELLIMRKFVVAVSGLGGIGSSDDIRIRRINENLVMIGDLKSDICQKPKYEKVRIVSIVFVRERGILALEHIK